MDYISKTLRSTKDAIQGAIYPSLASATKCNVTLHELCKSCKLFAQRSVALSWLDGSHPHSDWPPLESYRLCTVAHLRQLNGRCHFCTILHFFLSRLISLGILETVDKSWLDLRILPNKTPWKHDSIRLDALLYPSNLYVGSFDLCLFGGM